jgi:hypothetical protein
MKQRFNLNKKLLLLQLNFVNFKFISIDYFLGKVYGQVVSKNGSK